MSGEFWRRSRQLTGPPQLDFCDVLSVRSLWAVGYSKFNVFTLFEALEAAALDCGMMHEDIAARRPLNESVALGVIKPLNLTLFSIHVLTPFLGCFLLCLRNPYQMQETAKSIILRPLLTH